MRKIFSVMLAAALLLAALAIPAMAEEADVVIIGAAIVMYLYNNSLWIFRPREEKTPADS